MGKPVLSNNFLQILDSSNDAVNIQVKNNHSLTKISGTHDENFILLEKHRDKLFSHPNKKDKFSISIIGESTQVILS